MFINSFSIICLHEYVGAIRAPDILTPKFNKRLFIFAEQNLLSIQVDISELKFVMPHV